MRYKVSFSLWEHFSFPSPLLLHHPQYNFFLTRPILIMQPLILVSEYILIVNMFWCEYSIHLVLNVPIHLCWNLIIPFCCPIKSSDSDAKYTNPFPSKHYHVISYFDTATKRVAGLWKSRPIVSRSAETGGSQDRQVKDTAQTSFLLRGRPWRPNREDISTLMVL